MDVGLIAALALVALLLMVLAKTAVVVPQQSAYVVERLGKHPCRLVVFPRFHPGADVPAWGPPPSALPVLRAVKNALDPDGRFGPGRFSPWM